MKSLLVIFIILLVAVCGIAPYVDGYLFKQIYFNQFEHLLQQMQADERVQLKIESYERGWLTSSANVSITFQPKSGSGGFQMPPSVVHVNSIIHHGPLVNADGNWKLAYAYVDASVHLPDLIKAFIPENDGGFMRVTSLLAMNGTKWVSHYKIPPVSFAGIGAWDGLSGMVQVETLNDEPVKINNKMIIGKLSASYHNALGADMEFHSGEMSYDIDAVKQINDAWNGVTSIKLADINATFPRAGNFSINNFTISSKYGASDQNYNYFTDVAIDNVQLPPQGMPVSSFTNVSFKQAINNLSVSGLDKYKEYLKAYKATNTHDDAVRALSQLLTPTSSVDMTTAFNTQLGSGLMTLSLSFQSMPQTQEDLVKNLNYTFSARMAKPLLDTTLSNYVATRLKQKASYLNASVTQPAAVPAAANNEILPQIKTMMDSFIQKDYLIVDKNDYVIAFSKNGQTITLNNKVVDNYTVILTDVGQSIQGLSGPSCYWMENYSGKNQWIETGIPTIEDCFAANSCGEGLGQSGGGCYKWAASASAKAEAWGSLVKPAVPAPGTQTASPAAAIAPVVH